MTRPDYSRVGILAVLVVVLYYVFRILQPFLHGLVWAVGHGRNGILLAPLTADLVAAAVLADPPPALARACGGHGFRASKPGELHAEINEALSVDGPAIVDCVVPADELPNFPHLDLDKIGNFAMAKVKEALLAFSGQ